MFMRTPPLWAEIRAEQAGKTVGSLAVAGAVRR
jgi:hypothetical protein